MANVIQSGDLKKDQAPEAKPVGIFPGGAQPPKEQPYNPNQQRGSGYTNIQRVIQANAGNRLGQAVGGGIQQAGQQARQQLGQSQQQFNQQVQAQPNQAQNQQFAQQTLQDPTAVNAQDQSRFQQLISGQYGGPQQLANAEQLRVQAADIGQLSQALGSAGGRAGLLQRFVGNPQYTAGQRGLDTLLLGQTGGQQLAEARRATAGLAPKAEQAIAGAQAVGQQGIQKAQALGQQIQGQLGQTVEGINQQLQQKAQEAQTGREAEYKKTLEDLQSGKINKKEAELLGLGEGQEITADMLKNIGNYLAPNAIKASAQNIASQQDYARLNALRQLGGNLAPEQAQNVLGQFSGQEAQAGKFAEAPAITPEKEGFQQALQQQVQQYHKELDPHKQGMDAAQEISNLVKQRDAAGGMMSSEGQKFQQIINQKYPGAAYGGFTRPDWASANLSTAQRAYQDALNRVQQAYGGLQTIQVAPELQAQQALSPQAIQAAQGGLTGLGSAYPNAAQVIGNLGLENAPKVS